MNLAFRPKVDIILPFHGTYELVTRCLGSIFSCTPNQDYSIHLVDDGSPNQNFLSSIASANRHVIPIKMDQQSGFGAALQAGFDAGSGTHIVFMHSDVYVNNINWLVNLQRSYINLKDKGIKLISARTNNVGTSTNNDPRLVGNKEDIMEDVLAESPLPLHCAFCHRELFKRIGGFIKHYPFAWYEDEELFYRMKYYGFHQGISASTYVMHEGGATINNLSYKAKKQMETNRELCLEDVQPYLL